MTKSEALQAWFSKFLTAYPVSSVPDDAVFPWLTYELVTGGWGDGENSINVNLWYYTESEAIPDAKAQEMSKAIGLGGVIIQCDDGAIWIKRGSPWCQRIKDDADANVKRRYINISVEYFTEN